MEKLKAGEVLCPKCNGEGKIYGVEYSYKMCSKCWGAGKVDWIELAMGKKQPDYITVLPKLRNVYPALLAKDLVSVQAMEGPTLVTMYAKTKKS